MIPRYTLEPMGLIWDRAETKFEYWLKVEFSVLKAKAQLGIISPEIAHKIEGAAFVNVKRIQEIESEIDHDLLAFVNQVQEVLKERLGIEHANEFHKGLTSFDTEDPAFVLILRVAVELIIAELISMENILSSRAQEFKWALMIARTHGQYAEPDTFGHLLLVYKEEVERCILRLIQVLNDELSEAKISGAVGNYAGMDPAVEKLALDFLGLKPAKAETQIMQRDRYSTVVNTLAVTAGVIEQMARTFWEMMRSDCRELEEPRRQKQKGSSAMPHKKNPILTERMMGMSRLVRGYAHSMMESIATPEWRAIEQSCVERVAVADAFTLVHYMAVKYCGVVKRMIVDTEQMQQNLDKKTLGVWAAQQVRNKLMDKGIDHETAYRYVQSCCFTAVKTGEHVSVPLSISMVNETGETASTLLKPLEFKECFNARAYLERGINYIFNQKKLNEVKND